MGKARRRREVEQEVLAVDTFGGRVQLRWEEQSAATPFGQLAFFVEFLKASGLLYNTAGGQSRSDRKRQGGRLTL
jgi:hypothetical protein